MMIIKLGHIGFHPNGRNPPCLSHAADDIRCDMIGM